MDLLSLPHLLGQLKSYSRFSWSTLFFRILLTISRHDWVTEYVHICNPYTVEKIVAGQFGYMDQLKNLVTEMYSLFPSALMFKKNSGHHSQLGCVCVCNCCLYSFYWSQYTLAACRVSKRETGSYRNISITSVKLKRQTAHHPLKYLILILM